MIHKKNTQQAHKNQNKIFNKTFCLYLVAILITSTLIIPTVQSDPADPWWNATWQYRKQITIDHTQITADQISFPILIHHIDTELTIKTQSDGDDIVFTTKNGYKLHHELEYYNSGTGEITAWVNIPFLSSSSDTIIYMYYGNPDCDNQQNPQATWDEQFRAVHHLEETTGTVYDSTQYDNHGTTFGSLNQDVQGRIDGADAFDGIDDKIILPPVFTTENQFTVEAWIYAEPGARYIFSQRITNGVMLQLTEGGGYLQWYINNEKDGFSGISWDTWYYVVLSYDGTTARLYKNAETPKEKTCNPPVWPSEGMYLGDRSAGSRQYKGIIDEIRFSNTARSASWITTCFNNQNNPETFSSFNAEEIYHEPQAPSISNERPTDTAINISIYTSHLSFDLTHPEGKLMSYSVTTTPDIVTGPQQGFDILNTTVYVPITQVPLETDTQYTWMISATDGQQWTNRTFSFTTEKPVISDPWWNANWQYRKQINIDYLKISEDLENFPILFHIIDSNITTKIQEDGDDIVFTTTSGLQLNHELEKINSTCGEFVAWVNIPLLNSGEDTIFYLYYGNPTCSNQQNIEATWNPEYVGVWHMDDATPLQIADSTIEDNNGIKRAIDEPSKTQGPIGNSQEFDGVNDYVLVGNNSVLQLDRFTVSLWIKPQRFTWCNYIIGKYQSYAAGEWYLTFSHAPPHDKLRVVLIDSDGAYQWRESATSLSLDIWTRIDLVYDGTLKFYINGIQDPNIRIINKNVKHSENAQMVIGNNQYNWYPLKGIIDEVRISNIARNTAWITTSFNNQNNPQDFFTIGVEEAYFSGNKPMIFNEQPFDQSVNITFNPVLQVDISDPNNDFVHWKIESNTTGTWVILNEGTLPTGNGTVSAYPTDMNEYNTTYWWKVSATDPAGSGQYSIRTFCFTTKKTNTPPLIANPFPEDTSVNIQFNPTLSIDIDDSDTDPLTLLFRTNATGQWETLGIYTNITAGRYEQVTTSMTSYQTRYYWSINSTDQTGSGLWTNQTFSFTTIENTLPLISEVYPSNQQANYNPQLSVYIYDPLGDTIEVIFKTNATGEWETLGTSTNGNGLYTQHTQGMDIKNKIYYWSIHVFDGTTWVNQTYSFTTQPFVVKWTYNTNAGTTIGPSAYDVDNDGFIDIISSGREKISCINGTSGLLKWNYTNPEIAVPTDLHSPFEIADLNNDGLPEIVISGKEGSNGRTIALHANNGTEYWNVAVESGGKSIGIVDIEGNGYPYVYTVSGDYFHGINGTGRLRKLRGTDGTVLNEVFTWRPCWGGPSIADADNDGTFEIYLTDRCINYGGQGQFGKGMQCYDADTLQLLWYQDIVTCSSHCIALIDINNDSVLDAVALQQSATAGGIYTVDGLTWDKIPGKWQNSISGLGAHSQFSIHDVDGDGNLELIAARSTPTKVWDIGRWALDTTLDVAGEPPKMADIIGDESLEIIVTASGIIKIYTLDYQLIETINIGVTANTLVQDIDNDGQNELIVITSGGILRVYDTSAYAPTPRVRTNNQYYSLQRLGTGVYVPPPGAPQPIIKEVYPENNSQDVSYNPTLAARIVDYHYDLMNITISSNASGTWEDIATYTDVGNGFYNITTLNWDQPETTYYWRITATDPYADQFTTTKTYQFTTHTPPSITNIQATPEVILSGEPLNISCLVTDNTLVDEVTVTINNLAGETITAPLIGGQPTWTTLAYDDFETDMGHYTDGGNDCVRYSYPGSGTNYAHQATKAMNIQDYYGLESSFYLTEPIDVETPRYTQITVDFWFRAVGMENLENFWVKFYDGSHWRIIDNYIRPGSQGYLPWDRPFENDQFYHATTWINETDYTFSKNMKIRFECDASDNNDDVYIDQIYINATTAQGPLYYLNTTFVQPGRYEYSVYAQDIHGNSITSESHSFTVGPAYTLDLTTSGTGQGNIEVSKQPPYYYGDSITVYANASLGSTFTQWSGYLQGTINPQTIIITENISIDAEFTRNGPYQLIITTNGTGQGTIENTPSGPYYYGDIVTLYANATLGSTFSSWTGNLSGSDNPQTLFMDSDKTVNAEFTRDGPFSLTITIIGDGTVEYTPQEPYYYGDSVTLYANASLGSQFSGWSGDLYSSQTPETILMDSDKTVTATFTKTEYSLNLLTNGTGTGLIEVDKPAPYYYGDNITVFANASLGSTFYAWHDDLAGSINPQSFVITTDTTITAEFIQNQYLLTVSITGNGTVLKNPEQEYYLYNDEVQLTATAEPGWSFSHWDGDYTGSANPAFITITDHMNITAYFTQNQYTLILTIIGNGTISLKPIQDYYTYGQILRLFANAETGWSFDSWSGDYTGSENPIDFIITKNSTITAYFTRNGPYQLVLTTNGTGQGIIDLSLNEPYYYGDLVTFYANATIGSSFTAWTGDLNGSENPQTLFIDSDKTINAEFTRNGPYTLTLYQIGDGVGTVEYTPQEPYYYGDIVTLYANASLGSQFSGWSGDLNSTQTPETILMDSDKTITATFLPVEYSLFLTTNGHGTIQKQPDQETYQYNDTILLTAQAFDGWVFNHWEENLTGTENPTNVTITNDMLIHAVFTWINTPPQVFTIPDQTILEGELFTDILLDTYVFDDEDSNENLTWSASETDILGVQIINHTATISTPDENWFGIEHITFTATDTQGLSNQTMVTFTVISVNDPPIHDTPFLYSEFQTNTTNENLICRNQSTYDVENDTVSNTYHWYKNNVSLTNLLYSFNTENPSTVADYSSYNNQGSINSATWTPQGITGGAYSFDGTNDYITVPDHESLDGRGTWSELTFEYWMYLPSNQLGKKIISKYGASGGNQRSYMMYFSSTTANKLFIYLYFQDGSSTYQNFNTILSPEQWYHVVVTYKSGEGVKLYLNGDFDGEKPGITGTIQGSPGYDLYLGCRYGTQEFFNGTLDEIKIYPYALSPEQIQQNYQDTYQGLSHQSIIRSSETTLYDLWYCDVIPSDAYDDGETKQSNHLMIVPPEYHVNVTTQGNGTVTIDPLQITYTQGSSITLTATADESWVFKEWIGDHPSSSNPLTITMDSNKNITAVFIPENILFINTNFDSASLESYTIENNIITLTLKTEHIVDPSEEYTYWMNFNINNTQNQTITFHITNADIVPFLQNTTHEVQVVYSYDDQTWYRAQNHSYAEGVYTFSQTFTENKVHIATFYPYSYTELQTYLTTINQSGYTTISNLGQSTEHRNITLLTITNPMVPDSSKKIIYIIGRQHAAETASTHMLQGMIDFLISEDPTAQRLRDDFIWYLIPMVNPDGVYHGNCRGNGTTYDIDLNRDWDYPESTEISLVKNHINTIATTQGIDLFIDWHSHMSDTSWYNYIYALPTNNPQYTDGENFSNILSDHTDFDVHTNQGFGSTSARGYTGNLGLFTFTFEPTPHLYTWTLDSLHQEGINTAYAISEYFPIQPLITDSEFIESLDNDDLIANTEGQDWYESRNNDPRLASLDTNKVLENSGKKAGLFADDVTNFAYLTQEFRNPQTGNFTVSYDVYIDKISEYFRPDQNYYLNRTGTLFIGTDADAQSGPCSTSNERFITLAFYDVTPGDFGDDMVLMARESSTQSWYRTHEWTTLTTGLSYDTWYTITVDIDFTNHTYAVFLNDILLAENISGYNGYTTSILSHISFYTGGVGRGDFYIDNVYAPSQKRHTLMTSVNGSGSLIITPGEASYANNTNIIIQASPEPGYSFDHWEGDSISSDNPITFSITQDMLLTAVITQDEYSISTTTQGSGSIVLTPEQTTYHYGDEILIQAIPDTGNVFTHWSENLQGYQNPVLMTITQDMNITAHFSATASHTITFIYNGSGTVIVTPNHAYFEPGAQVTLFAQPNPGWTFSCFIQHNPQTVYDENPLTITIFENTIFTVDFYNSRPIVQTDHVADITTTTAALTGNLVDNGGENSTVWFEYDEYELGDCMGTIATGIYCKDGRSIIHKNRHYAVDNQKPRYYQGPNYSYFGIGHLEGMIRMGQNEKGLALVNMDVNTQLQSAYWQLQSDFGSGSEDNDFHNTLGQFETVADAAYYLAHHGTYGHGANGVAGQYLIISSEPGIGAIVAIDTAGHTNIQWMNNTYAGVSAGAWFCQGSLGSFGARAKAIMDDIVLNHNSSDNDNLLNWKDIAQRIAKDTYDREQGSGSYYYGDAISRQYSRAATVHVGGNNSMNNSIHMSWVAFGETTQISIFLPIYAGNLHSTDDIPSNFTTDNSGLGIHPYVNIKRNYARGGLQNNYFYADRVREIQHYAEYNENLTFTAFDNLMNTIIYSADEQEAKTKLQEFAVTLTPKALKGYRENITGFTTDTTRQYPFEQGLFSRTITDLKPGTIYYYKACANNTAGIVYGQEKMMLTRPSQPTSTTINRYEETKAAISWLKGTGAHFTRIEKNTMVSSWDLGTGILVYNGTGISCEDLNLEPNTEYYYQLWSYTIDRGYQQYSYNPVMLYTGGIVPLELLSDPLFNENIDSIDLRTNNPDQDWYESRNNPPSEFLSLTTEPVAENQGKKAKLSESILENVYLTQEFIEPQTDEFMVQWDIYIDTITDITQTDRTAWMMLGDDSDTLNGPCSTNDDRFMIMVFQKDGGGTTGTMNLTARDYNDPLTQFTTIATGLNLNQWYTIKVDVNIETDTYDVYIDNVYQTTMQARINKTTLTHLCIAQWTDGAGTFYVDNVFALKASGPVNNPPTISNEQPADETINLSTLTTQLSITIHDNDDDLIDYTIQTSPNIGLISETQVLSGQKTLTITELDYATTYTWYVNATDGISDTKKTYTFTTETEPINNPLIFSAETPTHGSIQQPLTLTTLQITIEDPEAGYFNWTIETQPDIGSNQETQTLSGIKTCPITSLLHETTYTWYVNATDGHSWTSATYQFTTEDSGLLVDGDFEDSIDSSDLRANNPLIRNWYESRNDNPLLLTLDTDNISGNTGKKAAMKGSGTSLTAYLSQALIPTQSSFCNVSCDMYIDRIDDYNNYDRTGFIWLGNDEGGTNGPCSTGPERFVYLVFYDPTPGDIGDDIILKAREWLGNQSWTTTSQWTTIATNLSYKTWYMIDIHVDLINQTYDVYIDDILKAANIRKNVEYTASTITHLTYSVGGTARGDFYIDNIFSFAQN